MTTRWHDAKALFFVSVRRAAMRNQKEHVRCMIIITFERT
jgi:hypothetical protein